jgi:hypothetical protein
MRKYSDFFQTLHDEIAPVGSLGRGTHYSVLRAIVFQDAEGETLPEAQYLDFAVIWDEDHDERVMEPIYKLYCAGSLSSFVMLGERKATMTGIVSPQLRKAPSYVEYLREQLQKVCTGMANGDWWSTQVGSLSDSQGIISADDGKVFLYLSNINMLWDLGLKEIKHPLSEADQEVERTRMMEAMFKTARAS